MTKGSDMVVEESIHTVLSKLQNGGPVTVNVGQSLITICMSNAKDKLTLTSEVYFGGNYIPKSVRKCAESKPSFSVSQAGTFLTINEEEYKIQLNYLGGVNDLSVQTFIYMLEDFGTLADEWRLLLDENDKNDLVHVRVR